VADKIAIVTGSNGLTGQAISKKLKARGYTVVGIDVADEAKDAGAYQKCDVTDVAQIEAAVEQISSRYGLVSVLVNNAGVWHGKTFFDITPQDYDFTYGVNTRGPFFLTQAVTKRLRAADAAGVVVNLASIVGTIGGGVTDYAGSKAAVMNFTKSLAKTLGPKIRIAAVSPAAINTAMGEKVPAEIRNKLIAGAALQRAADPEDIADVVDFLVSDEARYITGATIDVNGGL
jgi:NAD(P)-dependent dehydrogenase (short-subunit alcohol dehydrogenase family)